MAHVNKNEVLAAMNSGSSASSASSVEQPVSTPTYDNSTAWDNSSSNESNPWLDDTSSSSESTSSEPEAEEKVEPAVPQTDNEAARTAAAAEQNSFSQEALNNVLQQNGVTAEEWSRITDPKFNVQALMADTNPAGQKYRNAYMAYQNMLQTPAQQQPAQTAAPTQQNQQGQNALVASSAAAPATGTYTDPNGIYDPSKSYGRQENGGYVYSNSAKQLQNDLARMGYYKGAVDGYFGQRTQDALNAYLADKGIKVEGDKGSATVTQAAQEAPEAETQSNVDTAVQNTTGSNGKSGKTDNSGTDYDSMLQDKAKQREAAEQAWYDKEFEKYYGSPPNKEILDDKRIKAYVDEMRRKEGQVATAEDEINDEQLRLEALERQANEQARLDEMNARRDEAFTPQFINDLRNGKSVEQILNEGDLSYNRWIQDNWDDLAYTYNLGDQSPFESQQNGQTREPINYAAMLDELNQMDRNDWYQRPETSLASERTPLEYSDAFIRQQDINDAYSPRQTFNDNYRAELERLQQPQGEVYGSQRNGSVPERYTAPRQPLEYSDAFIRQEEMKDAYSPYANYSGSMASDDIQSSSSETVSDDERAMREAYEAAMQSAGRARDIFQGLPTEAEQIQQTREQWSQNQRDALERQVGPYMQQFQKDFADLERQFPGYSYSALADMVLFNEEMRNGQSSYYKWLASQL